jgi:O-antigen biosynthesis protein WbqP
MLYKKYGKKWIDIFLAFIGLLVALPLIILLIICIKIDSQGPIIFKQRRLSKNKKEFYIFKFRTMKLNTPKDTPTHLLEHPESYITRVGKFMRKTSLDELPQIINILKGEMSIIGPRPALWNQDDLIAERDLYGANDIYPGLTGWAQINGRDELPIGVKAGFDGEYVKRMSFLFDIKIFLLTILSVVKTDGVKEGVNSIKNNEVKGS